jgi:flagellar motor switch protein FliG
MADLVKTNPDAARLIKLKLVTVEMLPYIRDGHLLEIVMGLERQELLTFLVGAPEHVRDLLLSKAPAELAQSWLEDIEQSPAIEEGRYRISEMRILGRIRNLANNGAIRLVDINDRIFAPQHLDEVRRSDGAVEMALSSNSVAA